KMNISFPTPLTLAVALHLALFAAPTRAQERATAPPIPPPPPVAPPTLEDFARNDRIVAAVLESPRETPAQKLRAVFRLLDLGHPDVAALVLPEALAA